MFSILDVSRCAVSDRGLQSLCLEEDGSTGCCTIEKLSIQKTNVTRKGFKDVILFQKNLSFLKWDDSLSALAELAMELQAEPDRRTFPLIDLGRVRVNSYVSFCDILLAVSICPKLLITKVRFDCDGLLTDQLLGTFVSLPTLDLKDMSIIAGCENSSITFEHGIVPFLKTIGANIQTLEITNFDHVDPLVLVSNCPNLKTLRLHLNKSYTESEISNFSPAIEAPLHLEKFHLIIKAPFVELETDIEESQLSFFLGSPQLKDVKIYYSYRECF